MTDSGCENLCPKWSGSPEDPAVVRVPAALGACSRLRQDDRDPQSRHALEVFHVSSDELQVVQDCSRRALDIEEEPVGAEWGV